jgi:hypothetical protein
MGFHGISWDLVETSAAKMGYTHQKLRFHHKKWQDTMDISIKNCRSDPISPMNNGFGGCLAKWGISPNNHFEGKLMISQSIFCGALFSDKPKSR